MDRRDFLVTATVAGTAALACGVACAAEAAKAGARQRCPNKELNSKSCACTNLACKNHGICCLCVASHHAQKNKPACLR